MNFSRRMIIQWATFVLFEYTIAVGVEALFGANPASFVSLNVPAATFFGTLGSYAVRQLRR